MQNFGAAIFDATTAQSVLTSITGMVTDNFAGVAVLLGGIAGLTVLAKLVNGAKKGKVRV